MTTKPDPKPTSCDYNPLGLLAGLIVLTPVLIVLEIANKIEKLTEKEIDD